VVVWERVAQRVEEGLAALQVLVEAVTKHYSSSCVGGLRQEVRGELVDDRGLVRYVNASHRGHVFGFKALRRVVTRTDARKVRTPAWLADVRMP
jgi:hypothetical protein